MKAYQKFATSAMLTVLGLATMAGGCCWPQKQPTPPLGAQSDCMWRRQEAGASASDFVIYQHEFVADADDQKVRLNTAGEDHLRSIAARLHAGAPLPVVIERSMTSERPDSKYHYPVNPNPELDMKRREYIAKTLTAMGIANADQCVVVAPAMAEGATAAEATRSYVQGINSTGRDSGYGGSGAYGGGIGSLTGTGVNTMMR